MSANRAPKYKEVKFTLNGKPVSKMIDVRMSLSDMLRNDFSMHSIKQGCEVGECGACTCLIDGETFNSCIYLAVWADGKTIETTEGFAGLNNELSDIQQAFVDEFAVQCGFCTPGFIVSAEAALRENRHFTRAELRQRLAGNLCRCTGYENILNAVEKAMEKRLALAQKKD